MARAALGALAVLVGPAALAAPARAPGWAPLALPAPVDALLRTGRWDRTPSSFRIVALSVLADGCAAAARRDPALHAAALACVDRALRLADATRPPEGPEAAEQGLWLSHLDLLLGARDQLGPCADPARHRRLAEAPLRAWREWVLAHAVDPALGLPWSEATGHAPGARSPRGCALAWQTRYLAELDVPLARRWWSAFREHFLVDRLVLVGFREWPPGVERAADADSGPIVNGVGAAATAFAIPAARLMGDGVLAGRLEATAATVAAAAAASPKLRGASHTILAEAIRWLGQQVREPRPAQP